MVKFLPDEFCSVSLYGCTSEELAQNSHGIPYLLEEDKYRGVVISAGTNDVGSLIMEETLANLELLATQCENLPFFILETPDLPALNANIRRTYPNNHISLPAVGADYYEDGLHLNEAGSLLVAQAIVDKFFQ